MNATNHKTGSSPEKILVDLVELREMLSCGAVTAREIARRAEASLKIGKRRLYNVEKIKAYITAGDFITKG